jgi:hypothetical protein
MNPKRFKQRNYLCKVESRKVASLNIQCLLTDFIKNNIVVCNGGNDHKCVLSPPLNTTWHCLRICNGDLWVANTVNPNIGLWYSHHDGFLIFVHLPRVDSFNIMRKSRQLCSAVCSCAKNQHTTLSRGTQNHVFVEDNHKYCCVGSQYRLKNGFQSKEWDVIHNVLRRSEYIFDRYMDTEVIQHITAAKKRVNYRTMDPLPLSSGVKSARIYNGMGFGINVYLRSHTNQDFMMSIVQAHIDECLYTASDSIVCYFCFPRIGTAIALRPGDFLIFNPQEPHLISSRCNPEDDVYCISSYLKTAIVGLNDNMNEVV